MKIQELRSKTDAELRYELEQLGKELFSLRTRKDVDKGVRPSRIRQSRRAIARLRTLLHERSTRVRGQEPR